METIEHENVWGDGKYANEKYVDGKYIRDRLTVSRTKAYEILLEIEEGSRERGDVIRFGRSLRVRKNALERCILEHSIGGGAT